MAARKTRPVLYEVIRPKLRTRDPALKPRSPRSASAVEHPPATETREVHGPDVATNAHPPAPRTDAARFHMTFSGQTLFVLIAIIIVLLVVAFSAGRRYGAPPADAWDGSASAEATDEESESDTLARDPEAVVAAVPEDDEGAAVGRRTPASPGTGAAARTDADESAGRVRQVTLQKGYTYVVVQHFGGKRQDALAAARFLQERGVPCATLDGRDIRVVATQPFLVKQADTAAARDERRKADRLLAQIKEIGKEFDKYRRQQGEGGYTLSGCYLYEIR